MSTHDEMTRYAFISHMESYMKKLLTDPLRADTDEFLKKHGIEGPIALKMLLKKTNPNDEASAILIKSAKIKDNGTDEEGKRLPDSFTVKYKIPRKDYTKKMRNLYISLFESNIVDGCPINEEDGSGCMDGVAGATNAESSGQYTTPLFGKPIKRKTVYITEEQAEAIKQYIKENDGATATSTVGDYEVTAPMGGKVNKGSKDPFYAEANDHTDIMKKSWEGLNESRGLKSKKLYDIFKQYGRPKYGQHWDSSEGMDLHNITDNDIVGVFSAKEIHGQTEGQEKQWVKDMGFSLELEDGLRNIQLAKTDDEGNILYAVVINRNADFDCYTTDRQGGFRDLVNKQRARMNNKKNDGAKAYQWSNNIDEDIQIKEKNKGKFNATKARTGKSTEELTHSKNPITKKRAVFAKNAAKWKKK